MIGVTVLGSTGSIGVSTLDVIARHPDRFRLVSLTAHRNVDVLLSQCLQYRPQYAALSDPQAAKILREQLKTLAPEIQVLSGAQSLEEVACLPEVDCVMAAIVGSVGLFPTLAAVKAGKRVLLANKEALVMAGALFMQEVVEHKTVLLPIDSEHNAIFQCLPAGFKPGQSLSDVNRVILTASGGAFRNRALTDLVTVTPEEACAHPNWSMGRKITVDCATMMNKGLEVIEAHWLFGLPATQIETVLHPQSVIHSLVEYCDGSVLAQLGNPDMRVPISYALGWPERITNGVPALDLMLQNQLNFAAVDPLRYPCLALAYQALEVGGTATTILNAANEVAVQFFLEHKLAFLDIFTIIAKVLERLPAREAASLEIILEDDTRAREMAENIIRAMA